MTAPEPASFAVYADLAARTLTAIPAADPALRDYGSPEERFLEDVYAADRERLADDVAVLTIATAGLAEHAWSSDWKRVRDLAATNLRRTAALYGVSL